MKILFYVLALTVALSLVMIVVFWGWTNSHANTLEEKYPAIGDFVDVAGVKTHYVDSGMDGLPDDAPTFLFIHGASGNLRDAQSIYLSALKGRARTLFVDRPGHGYSERGKDLVGPAPQAAFLSAFLTKVNAENTVVVGHSYGGAVAVAMALGQPENLSGLVAISAPTHPWTTGVTWYHDVVKIPLWGPIFAETLVVPFANVTGSLQSGLVEVFAPQHLPDNYREQTAPDLVLRPKHFRANSADVSALLDFTKKASPLYGDIDMPTSIIAGDVDTIVSTEIHARSLAKQIDGSKLTVLPNMGHKPDYAAVDVVMAELERVAGEAGFTMPPAPPTSKEPEADDDQNGSGT